MLERDSEYFSKYAIDPDLDDYFESFELPDFDFKTDTEPGSNFDDMDLNDTDGDLWGEF